MLRNTVEQVRRQSCVARVPLHVLQHALGPQNVMAANQETLGKGGETRILLGGIDHHRWRYHSKGCAVCNHAAPRTHGKGTQHSKARGKGP